MYGQQPQQQQESIYNLIPKEFSPPEKSSQHVSKFKRTVREGHQLNKDTAKTMGPPKVHTNAPNEYLKKHEKEPKLPPRNKSTFKYDDEERRRPAVPKPIEQPIMGLKTTKNFITQNAVENIMSVPKKPQKNFVDTKSGDKQPLEPSGLEPKFLKKKEFGQVPQYLVKRKDEIQQAQEDYDNYVKHHMQQGALQQLNNQERQEILHGLKTNWENLHHEYQGLSVVTDTAPKKNRKERMEAEMKQLERDIELIEKHNVIFIAN
jgi:hypothetical protein